MSRRSFRRSFRPSSRAAVAVAALALVAFPARSQEVASCQTARVREAIEAALSPKLGPEAHLGIPPLGDFVVPASDCREVQVTARLAAGAPERGRVPVVVTLSRAGAIAKRGVVTVEVRAPRPIWVAARDLPPGTVVRREDLRLEQRWRGPWPSGLIASPEEAIGRRTLRRVRAGNPWRRELLGDPSLVVRGQVVRLSLTRGPLRIEALGRAREAGRVGDRIRVLNVDSHREIEGVVQSDGSVRVLF